MSDASQEPPRRVLIASANPLFAKGMEKLLLRRWAGRNVEIRLAGSMQEATHSLESWQPQLVMVDYDDRAIQRETFLSHFIAENGPMQVMLVSLRESGEVVVYDRHMLTPDQAEGWLDLPWPATGDAASPADAASPSRTPESTDAGAIEPLPLSRSSGMKRGGWTHYLVPSVLTVIFTFVLAYALRNVGLLPQNASRQFSIMAGTIDLQIWFIAFLFSLITVFIVYSAFRYRHRPGDTGMGANFSGSNRLEVAWTLVPLILVIVLAFIGSRDLAETRRPAANALEVKVTAFQWGWLFEYPQNGDVKSNQLYLPVNRQVHLTMTSRDVIHSFWVPEFGIKQDILPGDNLVKELRIDPTRTGNFTLYCNQMCGGAHAYMTAAVKVVTPAEFDAWIASKSNTASMPPAQRGQILVQNNGCGACHSLKGAKGIGPAWNGLAGSQRKLADGSTVTADDAYLHDSIVDPNKQIVAGFPPGVMPQTYKSVINDQQISDIIAFIKTIK